MPVKLRESILTVLYGIIGVSLNFLVWAGLESNCLSAVTYCPIYLSKTKSRTSIIN